MDKIELLQKIKALANNGVGGEKENAQKLLNDLMLKYRIEEKEIEEDSIKEFDIKIPKIYKGSELTSQVLYSIVGKEIHSGKSLYRWNKNKYFVKCTTAEFLEFEAKLKFYAHYLKVESERFYSAFIQANKIFPPEGKAEKNEHKLTAEDYAMLSLANNLEKHEYRLQIEG